jgi:hypothetical protein
MSPHFKNGYAAIADCKGIGNNILIARLGAAAKELCVLFESLTNCQARCTEILLEKRELAAALRLLNDVHALDCVAEPACGDCVRCRARALVIS